MPTYQYACTACGKQLEVVQRFTEEPLRECPACHGRLRKVFSPVGVLFKGSGFYRTDSRATGTKGKAAEPAKAGDSTGSSSSDSSHSSAARASAASSKRSESAA